MVQVDSEIALADQSIWKGIAAICMALVLVIL